MSRLTVGAALRQEAAEVHAAIDVATAGHHVFACVAALIQHFEASLAQLDKLAPENAAFVRAGVMARLGADLEAKRVERQAENRAARIFGR